MCVCVCVCVCEMARLAGRGDDEELAGSGARDAAVVLVAAALVEHRRVHHRADRLTQVVRAHALQEVHRSLRTPRLRRTEQRKRVVQQEAEASARGEGRAAYGHVDLREEREVDEAHGLLRRRVLAHHVVQPFGLHERHARVRAPRRRIQRRVARDERAFRCHYMSAVYTIAADCLTIDCWLMTNE